MEEAVTRKFVHEDSSHIVSFCGELVARGLEKWLFFPLWAASGMWRLSLSKVLMSFFCFLTAKLFLDSKGTPLGNLEVEKRFGSREEIKNDICTPGKGNHG